MPPRVPAVRPSAGNPRISYFDATNGALKYAWLLPTPTPFGYETPPPAAPTAPTSTPPPTQTPSPPLTVPPPPPPTPEIP